MEGRRELRRRDSSMGGVPAAPKGLQQGRMDFPGRPCGEALRRKPSGKRAAGNALVVGCEARRAEISRGRDEAAFPPGWVTQHKRCRGGGAAITPTGSRPGVIVWQYPPRQKGGERKNAGAARLFFHPARWLLPGG